MMGAITAEMQPPRRTNPTNDSYHLQELVAKTCFIQTDLKGRVAHGRETASSAHASLPDSPKRQAKALGAWNSTRGLRLPCGWQGPSTWLILCLTLSTSTASRVPEAKQAGLAWLPRWGSSADFIHFTPRELGFLETAGGHANKRVLDWTIVGKSQFKFHKPP